MSEFEAQTGEEVTDTDDLTPGGSEPRIPIASERASDNTHDPNDNLPDDLPEEDVAAIRKSQARDDTAAKDDPEVG